MDGMYTAVDCGSTTCEAIYEVLETCVVYTEPKTPTALCVIPCELSGCEQHIFHYINCAVWSCTEKSTPKPLITTSSPPLPSSSGCNTSVCISSVSVNVLFGIGIIALLGHWGCKTWIRRSQTNSYASVDSGPLVPSAPPVPQADGSDFQEVPLIARPDQSPQSERLPLRCFDSMKKFWASRTASASDESSV